MVIYYHTKVQDSVLVTSQILGPRTALEILVAVLTQLSQD